MKNRPGRSVKFTWISLFQSSDLEIKMFFGMSEIEFEVTNPDNGKKIRKRLALDI